MFIQRPHEEEKRSLIFLARPTVHTNPFRKRSRFRKRSSNRRKLKMPAFPFGVELKHFENGGFRKNWHQDL